MSLRSMRVTALSRLPFFHRLKADLLPVPGRLREATECARRGQAAAAFQPRDRALRRLHSPGQFGLTQTCALSRLCDFEDERELLLQRVVLAAVFGVLHPPLVQVTYFGHLTSLARCRATSSSRCGVFWVFLTNTRTITTRAPLAVT